jgi:hypothetical protein
MGNLGHFGRPVTEVTATGSVERRYLSSVSRSTGDANKIGSAKNHE